MRHTALNQWRIHCRDVIVFTKNLTVHNPLMFAVCTLLCRNYFAVEFIDEDNMRIVVVSFGFCEVPKRAIQAIGAYLLTHMLVLKRC